MSFFVKLIFRGHLQKWKETVRTGQEHARSSVAIVLP
jgi:hypothetical protein